MSYYHLWKIILPDTDRTSWMCLKWMALSAWWGGHRVTGVQFLFRPGAATATRMGRAAFWRVSSSQSSGRSPSHRWDRWRASCRCVCACGRWGCTPGGTPCCKLYTWTASPRCASACGSYSFLWRVGGRDIRSGPSGVKPPEMAILWCVTQWTQHKCSSWNMWTLKIQKQLVLHTQWLNLRQMSQSEENKFVVTSHWLSLAATEWW